MKKVSIPFYIYRIFNVYLIGTYIFSKEIWKHFQYSALNNMQVALCVASSNGYLIDFLLILPNKHFLDEHSSQFWVQFCKEGTRMVLVTF